MATLERPGVQVIQEIKPGAPTILTPTLNPCLIGPCFALLEPFDSTGAPVGDAEVSTPV